MKRKSLRQAPSSRCFKIFVGFLLLIVLLNIHIWNQSYVNKELEAPLDHLTSIVKKQFYTSCPQMEDGDYHDTTTAFPPIYMISARPKKHVDPILDSWTNGTGLTVNVFNTSELSRTYVNQRCRISSWKSRLFGIYQQFFQHALESTTNSDYIVTIEDDVLLLNVTTFRRQVQWAVRQQWHYFSLKQTSPDNNCLYMFGTVAQLLSRDMIHQLLSVSDDVYCRLPIDMYIAQQGPWYVTQKSFLKHVGIRFTG